jgi:hypothetical protein
MASDLIKAMFGRTDQAGAQKTKGSGLYISQMEQRDRALKLNFSASTIKRANAERICYS